MRVLHFVAMTFRLSVNYVLTPLINGKKAEEIWHVREKCVFYLFSIFSLRIFMILYRSVRL